MQTLLKKNLTIIDIIEYLFKISYLLLAFATFNSFVFGKPVVSVLVAVTFGLGSILMLERLVHWRVYIGMPYLIWLILFIVSFAISTIINMQYGFLENVKWIVWTSFQMLLLYARRTDESTDKYKREFGLISKIIIGYSFFAAIASIILLLIGYSKVWIFEANGQRIIQGFIWGRLWGVYTDPNYGAVIGVISIILSLFFLKKAVRVPRIIYIINIIFQFLYIVFSDSRTGKVALIVSIAFYLYAILLKHRQNIKSIKKMILNISVTIFVCILILLGMKAVRVSYNEVVSPLLSHIRIMNNSIEEEESEKIGREEDIKSDPSNRRFDIWESGMEILKTAPIFGTGYVTFVPYAEQNVPDTYVLENDHGVFSSMHNGFLNILVYQGLFGFLVFMIFTISVMLKILGGIWKLEGEEYRYGITMLTCIGGVVCSMMFLLEGTYTNSIGAIVLWSFLGWLVQLLAPNHKSVKS